MAASHYAEDFHRETINNILKKIGLSKEYLKGGVVPSLNTKIAKEQAYNNLEPDTTFSDCSGKHAGMLAECRSKG